MLRLRLFLVMMCVCLLSAYGQDIIIKTDGSRIEAKVTEVSESSVKYLRHDSPEGPLYTLSIDAIAKIAYANGKEDSFNIPTQGYGQSQYAAMGYHSQSQQISDAELLKLENGEDYRLTVRKYKKIAWIGGATLAVVGIAVGCTLGSQYNWDSSDAAGIFGTMAGGVVLGGVWCVSWLSAANRIAKRNEYQSSSIIEWDVLKSNNSRLSLGLNVMSNTMIRDNGFGASLTYSF